MTTNTVTPWTVTPDRAESLKGRECEVCEGAGYWGAVRVQCWDCHGTGRVLPSQVVAAVEGWELLVVAKVQLFRRSFDGTPITVNARALCDYSPFGPIGGVCEAVEIQVDCRACHQRKAPRGRSVPDVKAAEFCHPTECAGYDIPPLPPATFFNDPIARFRVAAVEVVEGRWVCDGQAQRMDGSWVCDKCLHLEDYEREVIDVRSRCWKCGTGSTPASPSTPRQMIYFSWIWVATVEWEEGAR